MEDAYRCIPIYPEGTECQGILFFINKPPKPIGYRYQKGINPRHVILCKSSTEVQIAKHVLEKLKNDSFWYNKEEQN